MKRVSSLCLAAVFAGLPPASAQMPVPSMHPHSLSLQVVPVSTGTTVQDTVNTQQRKGNFGGQERQYHSTTRTETVESKSAIEISLHNFGTVPDAAQVEWYFVAEPAHPDVARPLASQRFIFDKGSQNVSLAASGETKIPVTSQSVTAETVRRGGGRGRSRSFSPRPNDRASGPDERSTKPDRPRPKPVDESGDKLSGWVVRVVADGRVLDCKGSRQEFEEAGKDNTKLAAMTAKD